MTPRTKRLKLDYNLDPSDSEVTIEAVKSNALNIEFGIFQDSIPYDLSGLTSVTMVIRPARGTATNLAAITLAYADLTPLPNSVRWNRGTMQHGIFEWTTAQMNQTVTGDYDDYWWSCYALLTTNEEVTLGNGIFRIYESNIANGGVPPVNPGATITADEADARYVRYDAATSLTGGQQTQARENIDADNAANLTSGIIPDARMPNLTGDITTSEGAVATTIGAGKVTNAMLAGSIDLATKVTGILPDTSMPNLTGDITTSEGAVATTLATVNSNVGSFGSATAAVALTVNAKGLVTAASAITVTPAESSLTFTDITTNNATSLKHGFLPKLSGSSGDVLKGDGTWAAGGGGGTWGSITGTLSNQTDLVTALGLRLAAASNLSDLASASTARTNLGLGAAALLATSTGGNGTADSGKAVIFNANGGISLGKNDQTNTPLTIAISSGYGTVVTVEDFIGFGHYVELKGSDSIGFHAHVPGSSTGNQNGFTADMSGGSGINYGVQATVPSNGLVLLGSEYVNPTTSPRIAITATGDIHRYLNGTSFTTGTDKTILTFANPSGTKTLTFPAETGTILNSSNTSEGANGAADSGKVAKFTAQGYLRATDTIAAVHSTGAWESTFQDDGFYLYNDGATSSVHVYCSAAPTGNRAIVVPDASGTLAVSASGNIALSAAGAITFTGTLPVANGGTGITSLGTGVATALGVNVGSAGAFVTFDGALGTPSSGTLTNATGLPAAGVVGTAATLASANMFSVAGAVSAPAMSLTGAIYTGGTATTTKPQLLIEPTGTTSTAWATAGTGIGVNAPTGFTGRYLDAQINGFSIFNVTYSAGATQTILAGDPSGSNFKIKSTGGGYIYLDCSGTVAVTLRPAEGLVLNNNTPLGFASGSGVGDLFALRKAAATLQLGQDAAGVTNQMLTAASRITSDGVGANLTISAGNGRGGAGGSLIFSTYTTAAAATIGTLTTRLTLDTTGLLTFADAVDMAFNATTGTKIGTATTQKIGFWNSAPSTQPTNVTNPSGGAIIDAEARTAIDSILSRLETIGLFAA